MSTARTAVPARDLIINSPGHQYDGRRVSFEAIISERQKIMVHVEGHIYVVLRLDQVIPAPRTTLAQLTKTGDLIA